MSLIVPFVGFTGFLLRLALLCSGFEWPEIQSIWYFKHVIVHTIMNNMFAHTIQTIRRTSAIITKIRFDIPSQKPTWQTTTKKVVQTLILRCCQIFLIQTFYVFLFCNPILSVFFTWDDNNIVNTCKVKWFIECLLIHFSYFVFPVTAHIEVIIRNITYVFLMAKSWFNNDMLF